MFLYSTISWTFWLHLFLVFRMTCLFLRSKSSCKDTQWSHSFLPPFWAFGNVRNSFSSIFSSSSQYSITGKVDACANVFPRCCVYRNGDTSKLTSYFEHWLLFRVGKQAMAQSWEQVPLLLRLWVRFTRKCKKLTMGDASYRRHFDLDKRNEIHYHSWKEHLKISQIAKFGCELL
jgi:hypothetical protein